MIPATSKPIKKTKKLGNKKNSVKTSLMVEYSSELENDQDSDPIQSNDDIANDKKIIKKSIDPFGLARVLKQEKPKHKKHIFLSKSKKLHDQIKEKEEKLDFEIDGEIKEEKPIKSELDLDISLSGKKNKILALRIKPSLMDREREKAFKKIATKGVVQLFNAVRIQQKDLAKQLDNVGPLDHRKDAVLNNINKKKFLDVLMGGARAKSEFVDNPVKDEIKEDSDDDGYTETSRPDASNTLWDVLRNDFMTDKKMTNWDKDEEDEDDNEEMDTYNAPDSDE